MKRRTGRNSTISRASRKYRKARSAPQAVFGKHHAVEWLEKRVLLSATPTSIAVSASSSSVVYGQAVALEATVSGPLSAPSEGTVAFFNNGTPLATAPVTAGVATLGNVRLPAGADFITASYSDAGGAFASSSTAVGPQSTIETVAGGFLPSGLPAVDASISPQAAALDTSGDLFIADDALNVVYEVDHATGVATVVAGNGTAGFSGDGGPATAAELSAPEGVAVDSSGDLFIVDAGNNRIREVNRASGVITTVAGHGVFGFSGDGGPATSAEYGDASRIAVDSSGNLFIADTSNNRVREVSHATGIVTTVAGDGTAGFGGDGGSATAAELNGPEDIAVDSSGDLFIADVLNNRIREINHATGVITMVAGNGTLGESGDGGPAAAAELFRPESVAVNSSGDLFIGDASNNRIREVNHATGLITTIAGNGTQGFSGDSGPATAANLYGPDGLVIDSSGDLFFVDTYNNRIREVNQATGIIATVAGNGTQGFSGDGGPASAAQVESPQNVAVDSSGDLFIADSSNNRIREVNHATGLITTIAGNGTAGFSGDGGSATAAELNYPQAIAVDSSGDLFIADSANNRIREVNLATGVITTVAGSGSQGFSGDGGLATAAELNFPQDIAVNSSGDLFFVDAYNNRIREVNHATGIITTVAGNGTGGFSGDGGPATAAELFVPQGLAVDSSGDLLIADSFNNRVREVNLATGIITTVAGNGLNGFNGDGGQALAAELNAPTGIAVDSSGKLYIADSGNYRVRKVDPATGIITTVAGNGAIGFSGDRGPASAAEIGVAYGVAVDSSGDLFIADTGNNRVREISTGAVVNVSPPPFVVSTQPATAVSSTGATLNGTVNPEGSRVTPYFQYSTDPAFTPTVEKTIGSGFNTPYGVAVDAAGDVFVSDIGNKTVKEVLPDGTIRTLSTSMQSPYGIAVNSAGDVFVADMFDNAVKEILPDGTVQTIGSGFWLPIAVAVDAAGDVFVADSGNGAIKEVLPDGTIKTIGSGFANPSGVAVDSSGDVFVADYNHNAVKEILPNGVIKTIGSGFTFPDGLAVDAYGDVYVADAADRTVKEILPDGVTREVGTGFFDPLSVAVDAAGDLFVATIQVVELSLPTVSATPSPLSGSAATQVSAVLTGLTPGTTYYYRAVAFSAEGAVADMQQPPQSFKASLLTGVAAASAVGGAEGTDAAILSGATFTDVASAAPTTEFSIIAVDWGDGSSSTAGLSVSGDHGNYTVDGSHLYAEAGAHAFKITVADNSGDTTTITGLASVADGTLSASGVTLAATEAASFAGAVASFTDANPLATAADFAATIDWGDGETTPGSVSADSGRFDVTGSHIYHDAGSHAVTVVIHDRGGSSATVESQASVSKPEILGHGAVLSASPGETIVNAAIATFAYGDGSEPAAHFTASIDWGDGETSTGTVRESQNEYAVVASHVYDQSGAFAIKVMLTDDGVSATIDASAVVLTPNARYVTAVYEDVLGRAPDAVGLAHWTKLLDQGAAISSVAESIAHSDEYYANFVIRPDYLKLLGRPADDAAVAFWTSKLQTGLTDQQLEADLVGAGEFFFKAGGTNADWINAVYKLLLGRTPDAAGQKHWADELAGKISLTDAAAQIANSAENNTQLIEDDYFHYLGRAADQAGIDYWLAQFVAGKTNEDLIAGFTGSAEYYRQHAG